MQIQTFYTKFGKRKQNREIETIPEDLAKATTTEEKVLALAEYGVLKRGNPIKTGETYENVLRFLVEKN